MIHSDSRFFCSPSFLRVFLGCKNRLNYKINFEKLLATCIGKKLKNYKFIFPNLWFNIEGMEWGMVSITILLATSIIV